MQSTLYSVTSLNWARNCLWAPTHQHPLPSSPFPPIHRHTAGLGEPQCREWILGCGHRSRFSRCWVAWEKVLPLYAEFRRWMFLQVLTGSYARQQRPEWGTSAAPVLIQVTRKCFPRRWKRAFVLLTHAHSCTHMHAHVHPCACILAWFRFL